MWWNRVKVHIFDAHGMTLPAWINLQWLCRIIYDRLLLCLKFEGTFSDMLICLLMRKIYIWIHLIYTCPVVINIHSYNENYNVMCNLQHIFFSPLFILQHTYFIPQSCKSDHRGKNICAGSAPMKETTLTWGNSLTLKYNKSLAIFYLKFLTDQKSFVWSGRKVEDLA